MKMRVRLTLILIAALIVTIVYAAPASAACSQTLSVGDNVASAISAAANGSDICLNDGDYGTVDLFDIQRSGMVTITSVNGTGARMSPQVGNSRFIRFLNLTIAGALVNSCSLSIEFVGTPFVAHRSGLLFDASSCPSSTHNYVVDGAAFSQVGQALYEGRLNCRDCNGVTIKNSSFNGVSATSPSDGIQTQGNSRSLTIGPGNRFSGILESLCGTTHCDAVQLQGGGETLITGNLFENGDTFIMAPDGTSSVTVENNVFDGAASGYIDKIQFGSAASPVFRHNTLRKVRASFDSKVGNRATTNALVENNILMSESSWKTSNGSGCSTCTFSYSLVDPTSTSIGSNDVQGSPLFVSAPGWAAWQLAAGSPGKNAGNDGRDLGTTFYGGPASTAPAPATKLRIIR